MLGIEYIELFTVSLVCNHNGIYGLWYPKKKIDSRIRSVNDVLSGQRNNTQHWDIIRVQMSVFGWLHTYSHSLRGNQIQMRIILFTYIGWITVDSFTP